MTTAVRTKYDVGGIMLDRPFKIRRLGHFGFNVVNMNEARRFYIDLLGFKISDVADFFTSRLTDEQKGQLKGDARGYFTRYGGDHHAFVLFNKQVMDMLSGGGRRPDVTINQITWQVGSLGEVGDAAKWLNERGEKLQRVGRDMPGSNWHSYVYDPDGHTNELYYGIEQVGWEGYSKPRSMYDRGFREAPALPQINEFQEVQDALAKGLDLHEGYRHVDDLPAKYDVQGVLLPRPFKITRIGPVKLFVDDLATSEAYYRDALGFEVTEETSWHGHRGVFLRANTEHHSLGLFPMTMRKELGMSEHTTNMSFGVQLATYRQLKDAVDFLRENGVRVETNVPSELHPGMDYVAHAFDPDGHCIELYYYMEQVGWDGKPRPASQRRDTTGAWPDTLEPVSDTYHGEPYLGPWG
ncbi:MAG TPA: VOC family protein [Dehalococcoidia bacterium]|nr:VOC family protein [Dehalococcoidia bacterium]